MVKPAKIFKKHAVKTDATNNSALVGNFKSGLSLPRMPLLMVIAAVAVVLVGGAILAATHHQSDTRLNSQRDYMNDAVRNQDNAQALVYAKKALAQNPHDVDLIIAVANLEKATHSPEAQQYYKQAFDEFTQQQHADQPNRPAATYFAAAQFAEDAGDKAQAKKYYQEVIDVINAVTAPTKTGDSASFVTQSQEALKRLQ